MECKHDFNIWRNIEEQKLQKKTVTRLWNETWHVRILNKILREFGPNPCWCVWSSFIETWTPVLVPPHFISTYTYEITITPRVHDGKSKLLTIKQSNQNILILILQIQIHMHKRQVLNKFIITINNLMITLWRYNSQNLSLRKTLTFLIVCAIRLKGVKILFFFFFYFFSFLPCHTPHCIGS